VLPIVHELGRTRLEVNVKLKANFSAKLFAVNLLVTVPVPDNTARAEVHTSLGAHPLTLISGRIVSCWSPCRRRTTRRAPTSTQPRRAPGLPRPLPVIPTLNLPCWSLCQLRITQRAPRSTPASAHARPHLSQGGMGCQGEKPCPLLVVPAVRICVRPRKWQSAHEVSCRRLSSAALRRAQLLCCMPACDVRRPGILSRTSTKPLKTRHKDSHLH